MKLFAVVVFAFLVSVASVDAAPIYALGNECPTDAQMSAYDRQYYVTDAIACVFDPASSNIQGTTAEALMYFGGGTWTGLGQTAISGFTFTVDAGNDDGTFSINIPGFNQFIVAIKDGGSPKWAAFLLPQGDFSSAWGFGTSAGDLSHFAVWGRTGTPTQQCTVLPCTPGGDDPGTPVPDGGSTLAFLGMAFGGLNYMRKKLA